MVNRFVRKYIWSNKKGCGVNLKMTIEDNGIDSYRLYNCYINIGGRNTIIVSHGIPQFTYNSPYIDLLIDGLDKVEYKIQVDLMNCFIFEMIKYCEN